MHNVPASGRLLGAMWCGAEPPSYRVLCPCRSPTVGPSRAACPAVPWGFAPRSPLPWVVTASPVPSSLAPHLLLHCPRLPVRVKSPQACSRAGAHGSAPAHQPAWRGDVSAGKWQIVLPSVWGIFVYKA